MFSHVDKLDVYCPDGNPCNKKEAVVRSMSFSPKESAASPHAVSRDVDDDNNNNGDDDESNGAHSNCRRTH